MPRKDKTGDQLVFAFPRRARECPLCAMPCTIYETKDHYFYIECDDCCLTSGLDDTVSGALNWWNNRPGDKREPAKQEANNYPFRTRSAQGLEG